MEMNFNFKDERPLSYLVKTQRAVQKRRKIVNIPPILLV